MRLTKILIIFLTVLFLGSANAAQVAIIIDDIGYRQSDEDALTLPDSVTFSVLPFTPLGEALAKSAHEKGHEIMLHLPMQALNGKKLGPGGLTNTMSEYEVKRTVKLALQSIPYAKGANNHMGSLLTQLQDPMTWVMESLKQDQAFFVDSLTTRYSKAAAAADNLGIPLLRRQLFLDNDVSPAALEKQFQRMIQQAHRTGELVAIAHPYPETIKFLKHNLPRLAEEGISLVPTSQLLTIKLANQKGTSSAARLR